ncbi:Ubiquitin carboxyl-terminal hydrolase 48 [Hypsizygus marmoreus]|uniref:ubiquitinyl hydrolase 1 n=1 Tax=Hypsizygus marmoreus TaxID=39966 RepID=A0A369JRP8_HYPMA|nr:Ubiquitin carboxyl-terminal hydrolase 48 [Hypsizygus marmoreus]
MPPKRKRRMSPESKGLAPGEKLKRNALPGNNSSPWAWVGTEVVRPSDITSEHLLVSCGLSKRNKHPVCPNKYASISRNDVQPSKTSQSSAADGELDDDVIVISDDEGPVCSPKTCKSNPNCLNYLGQEAWEDEEKAMEAFLKAVNSRENPIHESREPDLPVGLKNLGATCYANASLQVWFRDLTFRAGVYKCQLSDEAEKKFKESPIFQLQVTFAALQESTQSVFNPTKLVESLQLRTTEQQDAQEFSKLFISHLDAEFQKQAIPAVKSLITDQFQGKQVYGTICNNCQYRSERTSDFLEIEINLENNSKLEDRIAAVLQPETLSGDNQYFCSQCDGLQDATRYTELRELPPVLHFSLLRFVYDVSTMERKKSKHTVSFPKTLDMNRFLASGHRLPSASSACDDNLYELRGILLHKGSSAYHGHYEAQVYDTTSKTWFQCNDEIVTKLKTLGQKAKDRPIVIDLGDDSDEKTPGSQRRKNRANARKRRRVDSDDEVAPVSSAPPMSPASNESENITSKDAYMLIYAHKSTNVSCETSTSDQVNPLPVPPSDALEVVQALNNAHDEVCDLFARREEMIKARFQERRRQVMDVYRNWNVKSVDEDCVVVSRQALKTWLAQHRNDYAQSVQENREDASVPGSGDEKAFECSIKLDDILCSHGQLDPTKASNIKRINKQSHSRIVQDTGWKFDPCLTAADICEVCVKLSFKERLYQTEHPRLVSQFDQISEVALDCRGFWISKPWLKDWRLTKPKMHVASEDDPSPDAAEFQSHVLCVHGALSLNTTGRRRISPEATKLLKTLYPSWNPLSTESELCPVCDAEIHISKESKRERRKQAEEEKGRLKYMYDNVLSGDTAQLEGVPCALVPTNFVQSWKRWLDRPTEASRPDTVDNTSFICEHDRLVFDPNCPTDLDSSFVVIKRSDWDILETLYPGGPLIAVEKRFQDDGVQASFIHDVLVCPKCRLKRKTDWTSADITIRLAGQPKKEKESKTTSLLTYSTSGARQSKRLRQIKELGEKRRLTISKSTTVKQIKIMVQDELSIPTICQRLFYQGNELDDNEATVASLNIFANDVLDLKRENEVVEIDTDTEDQRPRDEGRGFGGTLLGGGFLDRFSSSPPPSSETPGQKPCPACTFSNEEDAVNCTICDTLFK